VLQLRALPRIAGSSYAPCCDPSYISSGGQDPVLYQVLNKQVPVPVHKAQVQVQVPSAVQVPVQTVQVPVLQYCG